MTKSEHDSFHEALAKLGGDFGLPKANLLVEDTEVTKTVDIEAASAEVQASSATAADAEPT